MFVKGDKIITTKEVFGISKGEVFEVTNVKDNLVEFEKKMGNGKFTSAMSYNLMKECFEKYEEPISVSPFVDGDYIEWLIDNSEFDIQTVFDKCTVVSCKLPNGFVVVESSACVSPKNYNKEIGVEICMDKITDKIWELEGYKLQSMLYEEETECPYGCDDCDECPCDGNCAFEE